MQVSMLQLLQDIQQMVRQVNETRDNTALELIAYMQLPQDMQNISMDFARQSDELRRVSEQVRELQTTNHRLLLQNADFARRLAALESAHTVPRHEVQVQVCGNGWPCASAVGTVVREWVAVCA